MNSKVISAADLKPETIERFWEKVDKSTGHGPNGECWVWTGCQDKNGYGWLTIRYTPQKLQLAHRVAWLIHSGYLRSGLEIMHVCDYPPCVRHDHLREGTHKNNMDDCRQKGRQRSGDVHGELVGNHKLTSEQVSEIRRNHGATRSGYSEIGKAYGVTGALIGMILRGEIWRRDGLPGDNSHDEDGETR